MVILKETYLFIQEYTMIRQFCEKRMELKVLPYLDIEKTLYMLSFCGKRMTIFLKPENHE